MKWKSTLLQCAPVLVVALLFVSCCSTKERKIQRAAKYLGDVETSFDDWGKIAISDLVLVENTGQFKVSYDEDATNYVQAARQNINAAARSSLETSLYLGLALKGQFTPPISASSPPTPSTNGSPDLALPSQANQALNNFTPVLTLGGLTPTTDERQAVEKGINDKIAEMLLKFMANPNVGTNRQKVLFGVMQVTCQPGKKTRSGYVADVNVSLKYARANPGGPKGPLNVDTEASSAGYEFKSKGNQPSVIAVLPLIDSQNVSLENSNRKQLELATALSAAFAAKGITAAAQSLANYVKKQESDLNTRTPIPVATSYTDGSTFGFEIYPFFQGIKNPGKAYSASGEVLHPITFPAVVAILIDTNDLKPQRPDPLPQMISLTDGSFRLTNNIVVNGTKTTGGSGVFVFQHPETILLKDVHVIDGVGGLVLTNLNAEGGSGTFTVTSLDTAFSESDIKDASSFVKRLWKHEDNVSRFLYDHLDAQGLSVVAYFDKHKSIPDGSKSILVTHLNKSMKDSAILLLAQSLKPLLTETQKRSESNPRDATLVGINRVLLEAAYPDELKRADFTSGTGTFKVTGVAWKSAEGKVLPTAGTGRFELVFNSLSRGHNAPSYTTGSRRTGKPADLKDLKDSDFSITGFQLIVPTNPLEQAVPERQSVVGQSPESNLSTALVWDLLQTELRTRWISTRSKASFTMEERLRRAEYIDRARKELSGLVNTSPGSANVFPTNYYYQCEQLQVALDSLETAALSTTRLSPLPPDLFSKPSDPGAPKITDIIPHVVWRDIPTTFTLLVTNLSGVRDVTIAGIDCGVPTAFLSDRGIALSITLPPTFLSVTNSTNTLEFVVLGDEGQVTKALPISIQGKPMREANATITRDSNGKVSGLNVKPGENITDKQLLDAVKEILEKSEPAPKTTNIIP